MLFRSYNKIEEDFSRYNLSEEEHRVLNKVDWVVTEKIHGANFSILTDGNFIRYAKRRELLEDNDEFFGYRPTLLKLELNGLALYEELKSAFPELIQIAIYGELFGGGYPHPDVAAVKDVSLVQSGVYYSPAIEFAVFDILLFHPTGAQFMDYHSLVTHCQRHGLPYLAPLYVGKLTGALNFAIEFESTIPKTLGLPPLEIGNKAEGIVIKPVEHVVVGAAKEAVRPVIKRKIKEFSEDVYSQSFQNADLRQRVLALINTNRLNNALSKIGAATKLDKDKLAKLQAYLLEDIDHELQNLEAAGKKLNAKQRNVLLAEAEKAIRQLVAKLPR